LKHACSAKDLRAARTSGRPHLLSRYERRECCATRLYRGDAHTERGDFRSRSSHQRKCIIYAALHASDARGEPRSRREHRG
jgi:hypothetical protein